MEEMMSWIEKRKFRRLSVSLDLSCRKVGSSGGKAYRGSTVNVSSGGLFFETAGTSFESGNLIRVDLSIPPTEGLLELGGRISGFARVLRTSQPSQAQEKQGADLTRYAVAAEFCRPLKLST